MQFQYQKRPFAERKLEADKILAKYSDRVPIICEINEKNKKDLKIEKTKYLVPKDISIGQFMYVVRKKMNIPAEKAVFLFTEDNQIPMHSELIITHYNMCKNKDGFLYFSVTGENTFGSL